MESDDTTRRLHVAAGNRQREWARRVRGPVQFRKYTAMHRDGHSRIYYEFHLLPGQELLDPEVYAVMKEHQTHGAENHYHSSGLTSKKGGSLWYLPDHEHGRALAERIDMSLKTVAEQLEKEQQRHDEIADQIDTALKSAAEQLGRTQVGRSR